MLLTAILLASIAWFIAALVMVSLTKLREVSEASQDLTERIQLIQQMSRRPDSTIGQSARLAHQRASQSFKEILDGLPGPAGQPQGR